MIRYAVVSSSHSREKIESYLPANYHVIHEDKNAQGILIAGEDDHGWGLDSYVIPRFGSGLIACREVRPVFMADDHNLRYCMDIPRAWILRQVPEPQEARDRHESNLVEVIISHEACDDLERNDETSWTCHLNPAFFFQGEQSETTLNGTLENISYMLDSDALRREGSA